MITLVEEVQREVLERLGDIRMIIAKIILAYRECFAKQLLSWLKLALPRECVSEIIDTLCDVRVRITKQLTADSQGFTKPCFRLLVICCQLQNLA